ncbi:MAG: hypothetical protein IJA10_01575 [Lachnospiraceae bacterium]|nr:hypothetical protein [Lachnospiraceae bacterium]
MNELFKEEYKAAEEKLYNKGYYVCNMVYDANCYEVSDRDGKVLIDYLSLSQLCQLSEML